jgi:hypothetical protein
MPFNLDLALKGSEERLVPILITAATASLYARFGRTGSPDRAA